LEAAEARHVRAKGTPVPSPAIPLGSLGDDDLVDALAAVEGYSAARQVLEDEDLLEAMAGHDETVAGQSCSPADEDLLAAVAAVEGQPPSIAPPPAGPVLSEHSPNASQEEGGRKRRRVIPASFSAPGETPRPPPLAFPGRAVVLSDFAAAEEAAKRLRAMRVGCVGLDIEWRVTFARGQEPAPVALIQVCFSPAGGHGRVPAPPHYPDALNVPAVCMLFHVSRFRARDPATGALALPPSLRALLEDAAVAKAGCAIRNDAAKLRRDFGVEVRNAIDLGDMYSGRSGLQVIANRFSLQELAGLCFAGQGLLKPPALRMSNWELSPLTQEQVGYASTDAWASLAIFIHLHARRSARQPPPPRPAAPRPLGTPGPVAPDDPGLTVARPDA